ncbi:MAG: hypothetical protein WBK97_03870 [Bacteroidales bacterium]|jgi:hypothetical protein
MRIVVVWLLCSVTFCALLAQNEEVLLENLAQSEGFSADDLEEMLQTRSSLHAATKEDLELTGFLTPYQVVALLDYRTRYGPFFTWQEVLLIPGFSREDVALLALFFTLDKVEKKEKITWTDFRKNGKHTLMMQTATFFPRGTEYSPITESEYLKKPNSRYLGKPWYRYGRYDFRLGNKMQWGCVVESDAGERALADFISFHVQVKEAGLLKNLIIGDFRARFGQGLLLWNGAQFGKASSIGALCNKEMGLTPYTSRDENQFFRGLAATFGRKAFTVSLLLSHRTLDARVTEEGFTSFDKTGYHRTPLELSKKNALKAHVAGINVAVGGDFWKVGFTANGYGYNRPDASAVTYYNLHRNRTLPFGGVSSDISFRWSSFRFFSELAVDLGQAPALLAGIIRYGKDGNQQGVLLRYFSSRYTAAYGTPRGRNSSSSNEWSLQAAATQSLPRRWKLDGSLWAYRFPFPRYLCRTPSYGWDGRVQIHKKEHRFLVRQQRDLSDKGIWDKTTVSLRTGVDLSENFSLVVRCDGTCGYGKQRDADVGGAAYAELEYGNASGTFRGSFRFSVFHTNSWESRLYVYERDVLYGFSIPALYGTGIRSYLNIKYTPVKFMELWFKMACTCKETWTLQTKIQVRFRF